MLKIFFRYSLLLLIVVSSFQTEAQEYVSAVSWNLQNFGRTKTDEEIDFIAQSLENYDIIAIQEVVGKSSYGIQAVARLSNLLKAKHPNDNWKYFVSGRTEGNPNQSERYAFLWKGNKIVIVGQPWLDSFFVDEIEREPLMATFTKGKDSFTLVSFHAVPKSKQPESEIQYFKYYPEKYPNLKMIFLGDFNTPHYNDVFKPLKKMGYMPALTNQKTTLKMKAAKGQSLASEYDNFFYPKKYFKIHQSGIIPFYIFYPDLSAARRISDHVPVFIYFSHS